MFEIHHIVVQTLARFARFDHMNKNAFLTEPARKDTEIAEGTEGSLQPMPNIANRGVSLSYRKNSNPGKSQAEPRKFID
jgi:hypothetical protein